MQRLLAIFDPDTARAPTGLQRALSEDDRRQSLEADRSAGQEWRARRLGTFPRSMLLGQGIEWAYTPSTYTHYATADGVHALFAGEIAEWPGVDVMQTAHDAFMRGDPEPGPTGSDAGMLLQFYDTFKDCAADKTLPAALHALSHVKGRFAWIIYDAGHRRVLAARDGSSAQPLYWGVTPDQKFMLGSNVEDLAECDPTATSFPAGSLFTSAGYSRAEQAGPMGWVMPGELWPGQIRSFMERRDHSFRNMKAVPRINSRGAMCGAVYRVQSDYQLVDLSGEGNSSVF